LKILWFNWRDIRHPEAGGAEVLTHEVMKRLVMDGYEMTLFCPRVKGRLDEEVIDGVKIVRKGGKYTVYGSGKSYFKKNKDKYDFIIDEVNPRPFLTRKLLDGKPSMVLFHQMIREEWFYEMPFPLSYICNYYEYKWLLPHRETPTLTVSESSKTDLEDIGFSNVKVIPMGISTEPLAEVGKKEDTPTVAFIGRLKKHKLPDHAIKAFHIIHDNLPSAKLWIIGDGDMLNDLKKAEDENITFFGHVSNQTKFELLSKAHLVLVPSIREGWGLIVTESNAMGTPVVAYEVNGLRDSVVDGKNGTLVNDKSPESLARTTLKILNDKAMLQKLSQTSLEHSRQFSWDMTADYIRHQIEDMS